MKDHATFVCNSVPKWEDLPFTPTYYGITDVYDQRLLDRLTFPEFNGMKRFHVTWPWEEARNDAFTYVEKAEEGVQMWNVGFEGFGEELPPLPTGRTTPLTNAQLAAWMGYREFYFLGIEQTLKGYAHAPETTNNMRGLPRNTNPRYQMAVQRSFERAKADIEAAGGKIFDCTPGGLLNETGEGNQWRGIRRYTILEYVPLEEVL